MTGALTLRPEELARSNKEVCRSLLGGRAMTGALVPRPKELARRRATTGALANGMIA
jgi:hypothetical protein